MQSIQIHATLKIFHLDRPDTRYERPRGYVVIAADEPTARRIAFDDGSGYDPSNKIGQHNPPNEWLDPAITTCKHIGFAATESQPGVVIMDFFNA